MSLLNEVYNEDFLDNNENKEFSKKNQSKTFKNKNNQKKIKSNMIYKDDSDTSSDSSDSENDDENEDKKTLGNYNPVSKKTTNSFSENLHSLNNNNYQDSKSEYVSNYFSNLQESTNISSNQELLKKLDNILHILEEEHEEKNSYITEELILYLFLGIFIIYVLDNFVKVGKYKR
jgi:hypothetical protein